MKGMSHLCLTLRLLFLYATAAAMETPQTSTAAPTPDPGSWRLPGDPCGFPQTTTSPPVTVDESNSSSTSVSTTVATTTPAGLCEDSPCRHGGHCMPLATTTGTPSYCCECPAEYFGSNCSYRNPCVDRASPCQNGGSCLPCSSDGVITSCCICTTGFGGADCGTESTTCDSRPCENGGTCYMDPRGQPQCFCRNGFTGERCHEVNACASGPCQNGGSCYPESSETGDQYRCNCPLGYTGDRCEIDPVPCDPPCVHGYCSVQASGFGQAGCVCYSGYYGPTCHTTNPCSFQPCMNGGNCSNSRGDDYCICPKGFLGKHCQHRLEGFGPNNRTGSGTGGSKGTSFSPAVLVITLGSLIYLSSD